MKDQQMTVRQLIAKLKAVPPNAKVFLGSDPELNNLYSVIEVGYLDNDDQIVLYGTDASLVMD